MNILNSIFRIKYILYFIITLYVITGCSNQSNNLVIEKTALTDSVFKELKKIKIDSLRRIYAFYRGSKPLYVINCYYKDSCKYISIPLMRDKNNDIIIKFSNRFADIDSLEYFYPLREIGFSNERVIYCFNVMETLFLEEISTSCDYKGLSIKKDSLKFYYLFDTTYNREYNIDKTLRKLEDNWWVEK